MDDQINYGIIYKASFPNGKVYVGQTAKELEYRIRHHLYVLDIVNGAFQRAIKKYGVDSVVWEIIDTAESVEELNEKEIYWIKTLNSYAPNKCGYNMTRGGSGSSGCTPSDETRAKMSASLIGNTNHLGKKASEETLAKMSAAHMGNTSHAGKKATAETRAQMSAAHMGNPSNFGKKASAEARANMSAAQIGNTHALGYKHSAETRAKDSAAQIARQAREHAQALESSSCQTM